MLKFKASFDDGCRLDIRVAARLEDTGFAKEDVVFYIPSAWEYVNRMHGDEPLTVEQVHNLAKRFTVGSHTTTHPLLTRITLGQAYDEIVESKKQLERMLGVPIDDFCYPRGYANEQLRSIVRKWYMRGRNTLVGNLLPATDYAWETPTVHVGVKGRKEYEGTNWYGEAIRLLDEAVRLSKENPDKDYIYHLWGHSWEIDKNEEWSRFFDLLIKIRDIRRTL